jgi:hypothetical protein
LILFIIQRKKPRPREWRLMERQEKGVKKEEAGGWGMHEKVKHLSRSQRQRSLPCGLQSSTSLGLLLLQVI